MMEQSLFIELIRRTKTVLDTISKLVLLSREKSGDKQFMEFFHNAINREIEKHNLLLNTYRKYIESTTPIPKRDTVNKLIGELLKKHQVRFDERKIRIFKKCEKDLPETIVPDGQLRFILDSLFEYALAMMSSGGNMEFLTKSGDLPEGHLEEKGTFKRGGRGVEIGMNFTTLRNPTADSGKRLEPSPPQEEVLTNLVYRLLDMIVKKNQGMMKFEVDERGINYSIFLTFPADRRKVVYYQLTDE